jgi:hypothetical protein
VPLRVLYFISLKGKNILAQGNALGKMIQTNYTSPERAV